MGGGGRRGGNHNTPRRKSKGRSEAQDPMVRERNGNNAQR